MKALFKGVRVCVINDRSEGQRPVARLNVRFTKADQVSEGSELVAPEDQRCAVAAHSSANYDVTGEIGVMYVQAQDMKFGGRNAVVEEDVVLQDRAIGTICATSRPASGQSKVYDDGVVRYTLAHLSDSDQYKEFTITVSDSQGAKGTCLTDSSYPEVK